MVRSTLQIVVFDFVIFLFSNVLFVPLIVFVFQMDPLSTVSLGGIADDLSSKLNFSWQLSLKAVK